MLKNIEMDITNENLVDYDRHNSISPRKVLFYNKNFNIHKLSEEFFNFIYITGRDYLQVYISFKNDYSNNHIKICEYYNNNLMVSDQTSHIMVMCVKLPPLVRRTKIIEAGKNNPMYLHVDKNDTMSMSLSKNNELRGLSVFDITIHTSMFANVNIIRHLVHTESIIIIK